MTQGSHKLITGIDYTYVDQVVSNIRSSLSVTEPAQPIEPGPLLSIHLQSNRPDNFTKFLEDLEKTIDDPSRIEVVVKIDDTDQAMNDLLPKLVEKHAVTVKYISTPLVGGFFELWRSMNDMLEVCHPHAYFLWNMNDEMAVLNKGWDTALAKYIGLFPDHIFRLRTSLFRFRNYYDFWECGFAPETSAITTKRWIDICDGWNPCLGPDSFNQCVSFYFGYHDRFTKDRPLRDVPIHDILLAGEGAFVGLEGDKLWKRVRGATKAWYRLMSYEMQTEASRRSQKLQAHIWVGAEKLDDFSIEDDRLLKKIVVRGYDNKPVRAFSYGLSPLRIRFSNFYRAMRYYYYGGGGTLTESGHMRQIMAFLALRFDALEWIYHFTKFLSSAYGKAHHLLWALVKSRRYKKLKYKGAFHESVYMLDDIRSLFGFVWQDADKILSKIRWPQYLSKKATQFMLLRCLLLKHWYKLSNKELRDALGRDLAFRCFVGLRIGFPIPKEEWIQNFQDILHEAGVEELFYKDADIVLSKHTLPPRL